MARLLSTTFKSLKPHSNPRSTLLPLANPSQKSRNPSQILPPSSSSSINPSSSSESPSLSAGSSSRNSWAVYLILSTNPPIKTYVGVTNNFSRRLKQHNGEVKGGAKASRAGRPWICACLIKGFRDKSKAYEFESKWKSFSRKLPRKRSSKNLENADNPQILLLQHRYASLNQVKDVIDCSHLEIDWRLDPMPVAANEETVGGAVKSCWTRNVSPLLPIAVHYAEFIRVVRPANEWLGPDGPVLKPEMEQYGSMITDQSTSSTGSMSV